MKPIGSQRGSQRFVRLLLALVLGVAAAVVALPAQAVDVYTTPGKHNHNGRLWNTECEMYSSNVERCRTDIWAYTVVLEGGRYVERAGWAFNNLTYKKSPRATWEAWSPLVTPGVHDVDGRLWKTECDTSWTGGNACRSMIFATVVEADGDSFKTTTKYVFNNIVHLSPVPCPVSQQLLRSGTNRSDAVIQGCERSAADTSWTAVDFSIAGADDEIVMATALFRLGSDGWIYKAHSGFASSGFCDWATAMKAPADLADHFPYCS